MRALTRLLGLTLLLATFSTTAVAAPRVVADITPVHSLVAQVMAGVGEPRLIIQRGASPHQYALRPSEAAAVEQADVIFWIGEELTPWLDRAVDNLAADAHQVALLHTDGTIRYAFRDRVLNETAGHDDHDHDDHAGHSHEGIDPHAWLDPVNARHWLGVIAATLAEHDPAHADQYLANAAAAQADIDALVADTDQALAPVRDTPFVVFHDAYQYLERRFDLNTVGAISLSDARDPSPAHVAEVRAVITEHNVVCVFAEPQFNSALVATVMNGTKARTAVIDPLGSDIATGAGFYHDLVHSLTASLLDCLGS